MRRIVVSIVIVIIVISVIIVILAMIYNTIIILISVTALALAHRDNGDNRSQSSSMGGQEMDNTGVEKNVFAILYSTIHNWSNTWLYGGYDILGQSNNFIHLCWWYLEILVFHIFYQPWFEDQNHNKGWKKKIAKLGFLFCCDVGQTNQCISPGRRGHHTPIMTKYVLSTNQSNIIYLYNSRHWLLTIKQCACFIIFNLQKSLECDYFQTFQSVHCSITIPPC